MLSGVRVVDLAHMLAGGYGSMLLGDLGAEMIKIEPLEIGDRTRLLGPPFVEGESGYFLGINRNKKSVALDLRQEEGRQVLHDLVRISDVVFDNFRPGVMEEMGCGYETLKEINPRIIYCALSGFGKTGPYRDRPAFDLAIQASSGAMSITGEPGRPSVRMGIPMGDLGGSLFCAFAISAALYAREKTGLGRKIDIALMDCLVSLLTYVGQYYLLDGKVPGPMGSGHVSVVPYQAFPTKDIYIVVAVFVEKFWQALCRVLGAEELIDDPRFADNDMRVTIERSWSLFWKISFAPGLVRSGCVSWPRRASLLALSTAWTASSPTRRWRPVTWWWKLTILRAGAFARSATRSRRLLCRRAPSSHRPCTGSIRKKC
jgi:crotonobetainyl-CoA:carnitine CoA-transferase CaiB-like acyl-CoA transferase